MIFIAWIKATLLCYCIGFQQLSTIMSLIALLLSSKTDEKQKRNLVISVRTIVCMRTNRNYTGRSKYLQEMCLSRKGEEDYHCRGKTL
jgi:hypothetical protein